MKLADITPVFKKKDHLNKENYRPVSVLPSISKIFEKLMQKQINGYINNILSPYLCGGYRKGFSAQLALLSLTEKWKKALDNKGFEGAVLIQHRVKFVSTQSSDVFCLLEIRGNFFFCIFSGNCLKSSRNFISTGSSTIEDHSNIAYLL